MVSKYLRVSIIDDDDYDMTNNVADKEEAKKDKDSPLTYCIWFILCKDRL